MNRFGTWRGLYLIFLVVQLSIGTLSGVGQDVKSEMPLLQKEGFIYADIDTANQKLYVVIESGIWQYDLKNEYWQFQDSLNTLRGELFDLELGFNPNIQKLQFWSRGVGKVFTVDPESFEVNRIDKSHDHKNQFKHYPFFRKGILHAFGGYGYWEWHNIITYFNSNTEEWGIQNVKPNSTYPHKRVPSTGLYVDEEQSLFIFGGEATKLEHPDDSKASRFQLGDIWKYSFITQEWEEVLTFDNYDIKFYAPVSLNKVGKTNAQSGSFYDADKKIWYVPIIEKGKPDDVFYLLPIDLENKRIRSKVALNSLGMSEFLPTNFLLNTDGKRLIILGIYNSVGRNHYPIEVINTPLDTLTKRVTHSGTAGLSAYYWVGFLSLIIVVLFIFWKKELSAGKELPIHRNKLYSNIPLNDHEKKLLDKLVEEGAFLETQEIEQFLWPDIENYDYRRRLRNDIINSINEKFKAHFREGIKPITRKKDPNDNRRYLYGINQQCLKS